VRDLWSTALLGGEKKENEGEKWRKKGKNSGENEAP
jgi:hypothetical protein